MAFGTQHNQQVTTSWSILTNVQKGLMQIPKNPLFFYCDVPPRKLTQDQQEAVVLCLQEKYDLTHSDARGFLEASYAAVFPKTRRFVLRQAETPIVVIQSTTIYRFSWLGAGKVQLKNVYEAV